MFGRRREGQKRNEGRKMVEQRSTLEKLLSLSICIISVLSAITSSLQTYGSFSLLVFRLPEVVVRRAGTRLVASWRGVGM